MVKEMADVPTHDFFLGRRNFSSYWLLWNHQQFDQRYILMFI